MERFRRLFAQLLPLLLVMALLAGNAGAALLDVGPTVPQVIDSTLPNLGHGYPAWYRDTNRLPLELCLNEAMCFFAPPNPLQAVSFPGNIPDELFFWAAVSSITLPGTNQKALLDMAIEAAYSTGGVVPGAQVTFARMRIRIDTPIVGTYVVTTPFKQLAFDVTDIAAGINYTQDIGIAEGGVFTGALAGSVGPFLYCTDAPFPATDGTGGLYIGKNATLCPVLGSTFIPPGETLPANYFRVQGPAAFGTVTGTDFSIQGKIRTETIPTPITVDKVTYARNAAATEMQVNVFATTQPLANPKNTGASFPANYSLSGIPSDLQISGAGIPTKTLATNSAPDGKFFSASGVFPDTGAPPATITVTNVNDSPPTAVTAPLVDEVVISKATYNQASSTLSIVASSSDRVAAPALQAFIPGTTAPLGTLSNGKLDVTFPVTDNSGPQPKTYNIPPSSIQVVSSIGGADTASVSVVLPPPPPVAVADSAVTAKNSAVTVSVLANDSADGGINTATVAIVATPASGATAVANANGTVTYTPTATFTGTDTFTYRFKDFFDQDSNTVTVTVDVHAPPVAGDDVASAVVQTTVNIDVIANDTAFSSSINSTTVNIVSSASCGSTTVLTNGTINFTAPSSVPAGGTCVFGYVVSDTFVPAAISNVATVTVTITPPPAPVAGDDSASTITGSPVIVNLIANDTSAISTINPATVAVNAPTGGTVAANLDGTASYTPPATPGIYTFTYTVKDNEVPANISNTATVTVTVTQAPPIPPATGATLSTTLTSPQNPGANVIFVGQGQGGSGTYQYQFWFNNGVTWSLVQDYSSLETWNWNTTGLALGTYSVQVNVRSAGSTFLPYEASNTLNYVLTAPNSPAASAILVPSLTSPQLPGTTVTFVGSAEGGSGAYEYQYWLNNGTTWNMVQDYSASNMWDWNTTGLTAGAYAVQINVRNAGSSALPYEASNTLNYVLTAPNPPATSAILVPSLTSPQLSGTTVTFVGSGQGGSGAYEYQYWLNNGTTWNMVQDYSITNTWDWNTTGLAAGTYAVQLNVRNAGSSALPYEAVKNLTYVLGTPVPAATGADLAALPASPMPGGTTSVTLTGTGFGGSGSYEYQFWFNNGTSWILLQDYSTANATAWDPATVPAGTYQFQVNVRSAGSKVQPYEAAQVITYVK